MPAKWFSTFYDRIHRGREVPTEADDGDFYNTKNGKNHVENGDNLHMGEVCSIFDSPYRILRVAASGSFQEFKRLYDKDNKRLSFRDVNGALAIHHAAGGGNVEILRFILEKGTGRVQLRLFYCHARFAPWLFERLLIFQKIESAQPRHDSLRDIVSKKLTPP
ncbi:uncharacterized protein [Apostichopus japonicus]|uniref:uncharacterized protein n=1 Tax=Stichopus japonicus TaxID=307972 RepID=UPI003AB684A3